MKPGSKLLVLKFEVEDEESEVYAAVFPHQINSNLKLMITKDNLNNLDHLTWSLLS